MHQFNSLKKYKIKNLLLFFDKRHDKVSELSLHSKITHSYHFY